jgi:hypothetical protein
MYGHVVNILTGYEHVSRARIIMRTDAIPNTTG